MKLTKKIIESKPTMTVAKADALFGGQVSAWIEGEPIPRKYKSRLEQMFRGFKMDEDDPTPSAPITEEQTPTKPKTKRRRN